MALYRFTPVIDDVVLHQGLKAPRRRHPFAPWSGTLQVKLPPMVGPQQHTQCQTRALQVMPLHCISSLTSERGLFARILGCPWALRPARCHEVFLPRNLVHFQAFRDLAQHLGSSETHPKLKRPAAGSFATSQPSKRCRRYGDFTWFSVRVVIHTATCALRHSVEGLAAVDHRQPTDDSLHPGYGFVPCIIVYLNITFM